MIVSEFRNLIKEEIRKVLKETTLSYRDAKSGKTIVIKVDDYVSWYASVDDKAQFKSSNMLVGKVVRIGGSRNVQVQAISPSENAGEWYRLDETDCKPVPKVGESISATSKYNGGTVTRVEYEKQRIYVTDDEGGVQLVNIKDLS